MNDEQYSCRREDLAATVSGTNYQTDPAVLAGQIQSLVANPGTISRTLDRSPLFQVAAHLDIPRLPQFTRPAMAITEEIFAHVRKEALKAQGRRQPNQPITPKRQSSKHE